RRSKAAAISSREHPSAGRFGHGGGGGHGIADVVRRPRRGGRRPARAVPVPSSWRAVLVILAGAALSAGPGDASAGDTYLRAGVAAERLEQAVFMDRDCASTAPAALYGCGRGGDGAPLRSVGRFGTAGAVELGIGRVASPAVRLEAVAEYRPRVAFEGRANFLEPGRRQSVAADLSSLSAMAAVYVDLPGLGAPKVGPFSPFVGVGAGVARIRVGETRMRFPRTTTVVPGGARTGAAWMVTAGVSMALGDRTTLDVAWRYTDLGEVRTGRGEGRVIWRDGSRDPLLLDLAPTRAKLRSRGLRLSLRHAF
ncbi:MAG: outer membrane beta-barrel protein, partial [Rhodospirillales bacterium]|nr:outer membrane beta-barrel protein [Rhodospirillales bacterium]